MNLYLGLDSSTQGLKAIIIDADKGEISASENVNFTEDLPEFKCPEGVLANPDELIKHSDPLMWAAALDLVLEKLSQNHKSLLCEIRGISGSGQQHGSVYLNAKFAEIIQNLDPDKKLAEQLTPALSRKTAPIWMDSSTNAECREITEKIGPRLQQDTGSPAVERFTGPQIRKFYKESPSAYEATATVHLVSSFMASILCGQNAPIDYGDGAGMNLLNLKNFTWDPEIVEATAPGLLNKLPEIKPSAEKSGQLHPYFEKYGFKAGIPVITWSGDNPNSLIGTGATSAGIAVISLGTSDTFFAAMDSAKTDPQGCGHVFGNPAGGFMSLICFKNGSLAREKIKNDCNVDWEFFGTKAFNETQPGNHGNIMLPYFVPEITPLVLEAGVKYFGDNKFINGNVSPSVKIRSVVEAQALSMRLHSEWIGSFSTLRVTGGASKSPGVCQVLADVFQAKLEKISVPDSAGLGAAMRAANAVGACQWSDLTAKFAAATDTILPQQENKDIYDKMLESFKEFENSIVK